MYAYLSMLNAFFIIIFHEVLIGVPSNCNIILHSSNRSAFLSSFINFDDCWTLNFDLNCLKNNSTGAREGEYGGIKYASICKSFNLSNVVLDLWIDH